MSLTDRSFVVSAFSNPSSAESAIEALKDAGFAPDDILYSGRAEAEQEHHGGFFESLRNLFSPHDEEDTIQPGAVHDDLKYLGMPEDVAQYYEHEYEEGHPIVAVRARGHRQEAETVLHSNGGYSNLTQSDYIDDTSRRSAQVGEPISQSRVDQPADTTARSVEQNHDVDTLGKRDYETVDTPRPGADVAASNATAVPETRDASQYATSDTDRDYQTSSTPGSGTTRNESEYTSGTTGTRPASAYDTGAAPQVGETTPANRLDASAEPVTGRSGYDIPTSTSDYSPANTPTTYKATDVERDRGAVGPTGSRTSDYRTTTAQTDIPDYAAEPGQPGTYSTQPGQTNFNPASQPYQNQASQQGYGTTDTSASQASNLQSNQPDYGTASTLPGAGVSARQQDSNPIRRADQSAPSGAATPQDYSATDFSATSQRDYNPATTTPDYGVTGSQSSTMPNQGTLDIPQNYGTTGNAEPFRGQEQSTASTESSVTQPYNMRNNVPGVPDYSTQSTQPGYGAATQPTSTDADAPRVYNTPQDALEDTQKRHILRSDRVSRSDEEGEIVSDEPQFVNVQPMRL